MSQLIDGDDLMVFFVLVSGNQKKLPRQRPTERRHHAFVMSETTRN
jgi:hypothetical protein